jgi:predicted dehydrogenase
MRFGVIGTGRFGAFHCEKYSKLNSLVGTFDVDPTRAIQVSKKFDCSNFASSDSLLDHVDAVSICTPTITHFLFAREALTRYTHVFVEKPIATTVKQAKQLINLAEMNDLVLQVGHIERFNEAFTRAEPLIINPITISATRTCAYNGRCQDVDVVLDLMIHDLDIIAYYFGEPESIQVEEIVGYPGKLNGVKARLLYSDNRMAEVEANRAALIDERLMSFNFNNEPPININFHQKSNDALMEEVKDFISSIDKGSKPKVSGTDGLLALKMANAIRERVKNV